jgi:murein DD-endopeptidase MepM/ murein hydrolase activator NlpD
MDSCFYSEMIITQKFGADFIWNEVYPNDAEHPNWKNKLFYKDICKIAGHNGLDVVPKNKNNLSVLTFNTGNIIFSSYVDGYGYRIGIWNKELKIVEFHNHLEHIQLGINIGDLIKEKTKIGIMGNTGIKGMAKHNHIAFCQVNDLCQRLNMDNGFNGWLDPLLFI